MATYKTEHTTFLVRKIPVQLWKNCRTKAIETDENQMGDVILKLLKKWVNGEVRINK
tara:strand:+ start:330 stop:500 length:171 start_codon:yes stop_codon:yes gene_type:complete